jgi:hypothetical protein
MWAGSLVNHVNSVEFCFVLIDVTKGSILAGATAIHSSMNVHKHSFLGGPVANGWAARPLLLSPVDGCLQNLEANAFCLEPFWSCELSSGVVVPAH